MCRLAYIKRPFRGMAEWLKSLEASCGGDGNGIAVGDRAVKGVKISVDETVQALHDLQPKRRRGKRKQRPALWHTRRTSSGGSSDDLCHPFPCDDGWLCHNGHWQWAHEAAIKINGFGAMSDTRLFSMVIDRDGFEKATTEHTPPGVWMHMRYDGKLAIWYGSGDLVYCPRLEAWGSEPAEVGGEWYSVEKGWYGYGMRPKKLKARSIEQYVYSDDNTMIEGDVFAKWWR
jgi:hypothetical protein